MYEIYLFASAACVQLLYGKQANVLLIASPEFLPHAPMEGLVPLRIAVAIGQIVYMQISHSKSTWLLPLLSWHVRTTHPLIHKLN